GTISNTPIVPEASSSGKVFRFLLLVLVAAVVVYFFVHYRWPISSASHLLPITLNGRPCCICPEAAKMNDVTPYPAINTVLTEWAEGLKRLLGKKIVGLYLSGSLAYGDFVPDRSDIDLQAVVQNPLTQDE